MSKSWQCKHCGSFQIKNLEQVKRPGRWMVQGTCDDCKTIMRFTKYGSYIYAYPEKELEKIPF